MNKNTAWKRAQFSYFSYFICSCFKRNDKDLLQRACDKIEYELDLVNFLRHSLIQRIQRRVTFTKSERCLIRHQRNPFLLNDSQMRDHKGSDSDSEDFDPVRPINRSNQPINGKLIEGAFIDTNIDD